MDQSLLDLPDDALLAVLAYLSPAELLGCRVVCRRLRDLCLHSDLWKSAAIDCELLPALRVAPCLRKLSLENMIELTLTEKVASLLANTACVVAELHLCVRFVADSVFVTAVVKKFSALGGLRALKLTFSDFVDFSSTASLLKEAISAIDLRELTIYPGACPPQSSALWPSSIMKVRPSLTKLHYFGNRDPLLELLLKTHASTLEEVSLPSVDRIPMAFLGKMPRLRSLTCQPKDDLLYSEALSNLDTLYLVPNDRGIFSASALDFLRRASHLRSVSISLSDKESLKVPLQALSSSPSAQFIETLALVWNYGEAVGWELAVNILHQFPSLQSLSLEIILHGAALDKFLQAVTPTSAPALTSLFVSPRSGECAHAWLHSSVIQNLLERNPRLHLRVDGLNSEHFCRCPWCRRGCHLELRNLDDMHQLAMAGHRRMVGCPSVCRRWP